MVNSTGSLVGRAVEHLHGEDRRALGIVEVAGERRVGDLGADRDASPPARRRPRCFCTARKMRTSSKSLRFSRLPISGGKGRDLRLRAGRRR